MFQLDMIDTMDDHIALNENEQRHLSDFVKSQRQTSQRLFPLSTLEDLDNALTHQQRDVVQKIKRLDPKKFGFQGPYLGQQSLPKHMAVLKSQHYTRDQKIITLPDQYVPLHVHTAFQKMKAAFEKDQHGKTLLVEQGYRSPAYQLVVLIELLVTVYEFDIARTLRRVAMPGYSQHGSITNTALDLMNTDGIPTDEAPEEFGKTVEYAWLKAHAEQFNFVEAYPQNNRFGIDWEPWHWQYNYFAANDPGR